MFQHDAPNSVVVHLEIIMDKDVPHPHNSGPWQIGSSLTRSYLDSRCRLADELHTMNQRVSKQHVGV